MMRGEAAVSNEKQIRKAPNSWERGAMKSPIVKRSIVLAGHKTSVSLEEPFWRALKDIAGSRRMTLSDLISSIDHERKHGNLSSALRLFVLNHYQARAA
jgi:predicted DNA-binding ribbon-helix-helix protein